MDMCRIPLIQLEYYHGEALLHHDFVSPKILHKQKTILQKLRTKYGAEAEDVMMKKKEFDLFQHLTIYGWAGEYIYQQQQLYGGCTMEAFKEAFLSAAKDYQYKGTCEDVLDEIMKEGMFYEKENHILCVS